MRSTRAAVLLAVAFVTTAIVAIVLALPLTCNHPTQGVACVDPTPGVESPVDGVVISVEAASLTEVRGFALRPSNGGGFAFSFRLGVLENATSFSPSHLKEHMATSEPVRVWFRVENGERVVYRIEDATEAPTAT